MNKKIGQKIYKVDLYELGDRKYRFSDNDCVGYLLGKVLVTSYKKGGTNFSKSIGKCTEIMEDFNITVIDCVTGTHYEGGKKYRNFYLPSEYDCEIGSNRFVVLAKDLDEKNIASEEDIKNYAPSSTIWYKYLKKMKGEQDDEKTL